MRSIVRGAGFYAAIAVLVLVAASCGGGRKDTGLPSGPTPEPTAVKGSVQVKDNVFEPKDVTIKVGEEVTWIFAGSAQPHNAVADDGSFNSHPGCASNAQPKCSTGSAPDFKFKFAKAGEFAYYCAIHGFKGGLGMAGKVIVQA